MRLIGSGEGAFEVMQAYPRAGERLVLKGSSGKETKRASLVSLYLTLNTDDE